MEFHKLVREILNTKKVWEMSGNFIISISLDVIYRLQEAEKAIRTQYFGQGKGKSEGFFFADWGWSPCNICQGPFYGTLGNNV